MGNMSDHAIPSPNPAPPTPLGESASSISLLDAQDPFTDPPITRYFDDDAGDQDDDFPPMYSDHDAAVGVPNPLLPPAAPKLLIEPLKEDANAAYYLDGRLDNDPEFLQQQVKLLALIPPRPFVRLRGVHRETAKKDGKSEHSERVDFDVHIELTSLLYTDIQRQQAWRSLQTVSDFDKVRRGTVFATRAPGFGGSGIPSAATPTVQEWCHRYCASHAGLKTFVLERRIDGWDWDRVRRRLDDLVRATNYRGRWEVTFPVQNARVEIMNDCRTNRLRLNTWIRLVCAFTLMFLFTWPWLFFRTRRYETVYAEWQMSRVDHGRRLYASLAEDRWYNLWARSIQRALLNRRQGYLDQGDLEANDYAPVQVSVEEAMGMVNRSFGWGNDQ